MSGPPDNLAIWARMVMEAVYNDYHAQRYMEARAKSYTLIANPCTPFLYTIAAHAMISRTTADYHVAKGFCEKGLELCSEAEEISSAGIAPWREHFNTMLRIRARNYEEDLAKAAAIDERERKESQDQKEPPSQLKDDEKEDDGTNLDSTRDIALPFRDRSEHSPSAKPA